MYKWIAAGCLIGFGAGLLVASIIFETWLSPYGNPITIDYTMWYWSPQVDIWRNIGIMWLLTGIIGTYLLYKLGEKKPNPSPKPSENTQKKPPSMPTTTPSPKPSIESPQRKHIVIRHRYLLASGLIASYTIFAAICFAVGLASIKQLAILTLTITAIIIAATIITLWHRLRQKTNKHSTP